MYVSVLIKQIRAVRKFTANGQMLKALKLNNFKRYVIFLRAAYFLLPFQSECAKIDVLQTESL